MLDKDNVIIAGHTRYHAAKELGLLEVPVIILAELSEAQAQALRIADNKLAELSEWDNDKLMQELMELKDADFNIDLTGFNFDELNTLMNKEIDGSGLSDEDSIPDARELPKAKTGDVWVLGDHRLICGNSESVEVIQNLIGNNTIDLVFTDPPYNLAEESKNFAAHELRKSYQTLKNSEWDKGFKVEPFLDVMLPHLSPGATVFVCTSHYLFGDIIKWMRSSLGYSNYCVWCKTNPMPSLSKRRFTWATELLCYGTNDGHIFNFPEDGHALNYLVESSPTHTTDHPTEKPVSVVEHYIALTSKPGNTVLDLFGGSGTTLLTCEKLKRKCFMSELSPIFCDIIINRWQNYTGKDAVLESTGELFNSINP